MSKFFDKGFVRIERNGFPGLIRTFRNPLLKIHWLFLEPATPIRKQDVTMRCTIMSKERRLPIPALIIFFKGHNFFRFADESKQEQNG